MRAIRPIWEAYYPYDAGVAIDAPLTKDSMDSVRSFVEERCEVEDSVTYYLYVVPDEAIEALSLSDYNHLREILGLSPVTMSNNEFLVHCDTWNHMDSIRQGLGAEAGDHAKRLDIDPCGNTDLDRADGAVSDGWNKRICSGSAG